MSQPLQPPSAQAAPPAATANVAPVAAAASPPSAVPPAAGAAATGPPPPAETELSGVMVVIIIAGGVLLSIVLFIFAKRQIMRFTIRSRRGPHAPVGHDAKKSIKREIERRLDCIPRIVHEPQLIWDDDSRYIVQPESPLPPFYWRLKAVDDIKVLEREIAKQDGSVRTPRDSIRAFLLSTLAAAMNSGTGQRLIHQFCDMYEHARHDPSCFGRDEYEAYRRLLLKLLDAAKMIKSFGGASRKSSPSRTPLKKQQFTKNQSLLDPSRLRPPPLLSPGAGGVGGDLIGSNNRLNITLGLQQQQQQQQQQQHQQRRMVTGGTESSDLCSADDENEILSISFTGTGDTSVV